MLGWTQGGVHGPRSLLLWIGPHSSPRRPCTAVGQLDAISQSGGWWGRKVAVDGPAHPLRMAALR